MNIHNSEGASRPTLRARLIGEFRLFFTLFIYLWVLLGVFVLHEDIVLREHGGGVVFQGFALLNALVLGKVMLIAEHLDLARGLRKKPAIYSILLEALLCTVLFIVFHVIERLVVSLIRGPQGGEDSLSTGGGGYLGVVLIAVVLFVSLLPFFAFKNLTRLIGWPRMRRYLFSSPEASEMEAAAARAPTGR
ncbi:hypothetical protein V5F53_11405 [Xanthobacter sp. V4C-4]|uniref:hypothetical protein n=1 Tax=Xanthobacter cornucopiae TaxID=3119924 RepID=UPI00372BA71B